uniref:Uncharacterized protein n=1 Tax=Anguilla anguilla TaxID=7936 RepID=A0A0E9TDC7_ANGAN
MILNHHTCPADDHKKVSEIHRCSPFLIWANCLTHFMYILNTLNAHIRYSGLSCHFPTI